MSEFCGLWKHENNSMHLYPRRWNDAAQLVEELKTVTYTTLKCYIEERRKKKKKPTFFTVHDQITRHIFWSRSVRDTAPRFSVQCRRCPLPAVGCWSCRWSRAMRSACWGWCSTLRTTCSRSGSNPGSSSTGSSTTCECTAVFGGGGDVVLGGECSHSELSPRIKSFPNSREGVFHRRS